MGLKNRTVHDEEKPSWRCVKHDINDALLLTVALGNFRKRTGSYIRFTRPSELTLYGMKLSREVRKRLITVEKPEMQKIKKFIKLIYD